MKKLLFLSFLALLVFGLGASGMIVAVMFKLLQPVDPNDKTVVSFVIPKGQAVERIGERLEEQQLIKSALGFRYVVWKEGVAAKIQAGSFQLSPSLTQTEIVQELTEGTNDLWVTIPEGKRREELPEYFKEFPEFDAAEFLALSEDDEGYLFPDTYLFPIQADAVLVYNQLRSNFDNIVKQNQLDLKLKKNNANMKSIVTMASLLEREAQSAQDMKIVAGILYNRVQNGMPLQVDATMQYAKGYDSKTKQWWSPPLAADKKIDSPYNTYLVIGLPPGPIANPGLKALLAALEPTASEYLFYITDNTGKMHYAVTYDEHLANIEQYLR